MNGAEVPSDPASKLLIVDDSQMNLRLLATMLTEQEYIVYSALDGKTALEIVQFTLPDLILLDILMPGMDGYQVCQQLKADDRTRDIPVVFMTALTEMKDKVKGFKAGGVDYITKPLQYEEVLARIKTHLSLRKMQKKLEAQNVQLLQEINDRKEAEAALRKSEAHLHALIDNLPFEFWAMDGDLRYMMQNVTSLKSYGNVIGKCIDELGLPAEVLGKWIKQDQQVLQGEILHDEYEVMVESEKRTYKNVVAPVFVDEVIVGIVGVGMDITEQKAMEQQVVRAERLAAMGQITATLAHEIKNPLQAIQSNIDLLLDFPLETDERDQCLQTCRREIDRLMAISQRMLSFSRPGRDEYQPVGITRLWQQTLALLKTTLEKAAIHITTELPEDLPAVMGSFDQLGQVLLNLVLNSIEAMPNGGTIHFSAHPEMENLILRLANNGPAIPAEHLQRLFEPFFTSKPSGTGLGLVVVQNIIYQHGGTLKVENLEDEKGVAVTIALPLAEPDRVIHQKPGWIG